MFAIGSWRRPTESLATPAGGARAVLYTRALTGADSFCHGPADRFTLTLDLTFVAPEENESQRRSRRSAILSPQNSSLRGPHPLTDTHTRGFAFFST
ncbi:unnamed protein product [Pleuronectes platessa]|uniref:Uncharacterized protein n=1 Tax=Pleuronectes platessa TaxID=8262 RepID=A0A9N7UVF4_PLEPL|nr:unnamed protein product [Pleuronectes platessa]